MFRIQPLEQYKITTFLDFWWEKMIFVPLSNVLSSDHPPDNPRRRLKPR